MNTARFLVAAALVAAPAAASTVDHVAPVTALANERLIPDFTGGPVVAAVLAQNAAHAALTQADIDARDQTWRAEVEGGGGPLSGGVLSNALSAHLREVVAGYEGLVTEVFVMDMHGLNVGQADMTSDYWQGDEAKFQKTHGVGPGVGPGAVFVDEVEFDESSQTLQTQVSFSVVDPATGALVGAVTVGVNVDALP